MIYASKVALQQTEELWRRVIKQDDNAVLPREFLGRWCFFIHDVYTGAIIMLCSLLIMLMPIRNQVLFVLQRKSSSSQA